MDDDQKKSKQGADADVDSVVVVEQNTDKSAESEQTSPTVITSTDELEEEETDGNEKTRLDPDLECMITDSKKCVDSKILLKTVEAVKVFLRQDKEKNVNVLLKFKHFQPFFVKCLQHNSNNSSLQYNLAWIFEVILSKGYFCRVESFLDQETVIIPLFVKLLQSPDRTIYEMVALVLTYLVRKESSRTQLISISSSVFAPLAKLLKTKNPSEKFIKCCAQIVCDILNFEEALRKNIIERIQGKGPQRFEKITNATGNGIYIASDEVEDYMPSSRLVKQTLPVISVLLDCSDDQIRIDMLQCLTVATAVLENIRPLVDSGCCSKLVSFFSYYDDCAICAGAIIATGSIATLCPLQLLAFLKALKGTDGLQHYWKVLKMDLKSTENLRQAVCLFMDGVADIVHHNVENEGIDATIECGMVESLIQSINDNEIQQEWQDASLSILNCMIHQLPIEKRGVVATAMLPKIVELLRTRVTCAMTTKCTGALAKLIEGSMERRDRAIELGVIPILLEMLEKSTPEHFQEKTNNVLKCLELMLEMKPCTSVQYFADVPFALRDFLEDMPVALESNVTIALNVVAKIASYAISSSIELIIEADLIPIVLSFLHYPHDKIQSSAIEIVFRMCVYGNDEQRKRFLKAGVLDKFNELLEATEDNTRKRALEILLVFLMRKRITSGAEKQTMKKLSPLVEMELSTNVLDTQSIAKIVSQKILKLK